MITGLRSADAGSGLPDAARSRSAPKRKCGSGPPTFARRGPGRRLLSSRGRLRDRGRSGPRRPARSRSADREQAGNPLELNGVIGDVPSRARACRLIRREVPRATTSGGGLFGSPSQVARLGNRRGDAEQSYFLSFAVVGPKNLRAEQPSPCFVRRDSIQNPR